MLTEFLPNLVINCESMILLEAFSFTSHDHCSVGEDYYGGDDD